jgi:RNA polymerase sigma factor (sigma-70 family)
VPPTLLQRVADNEPGAAEACLESYGGLVWSLARRFLQNRADAEDAAQEIFVDIWKSAGRYDPAVASEAAFVAMIARRRLIDRLRKSGRTPKTAELLEETTLSQPTAGKANGPEGAEDLAQAIAAMDALGTEQSRVLRLSLGQGLSHQQIADATGMPVGTVKTHIRRGLIQVRQRVAQARVEAST